MLYRAWHHFDEFRCLLVNAVFEIPIDHDYIEKANIVIEIYAQHFDCKHEGIIGRTDGDVGFGWIEFERGGGGPTDDLHVDSLDGGAHEQRHEHHDHHQRADAARSGLVLALSLETQELRSRKQVKRTENFLSCIQGCHIYLSQIIYITLKVIINKVRFNHFRSHSKN